MTDRRRGGDRGRHAGDAASGAMRRAGRGGRGRACWAGAAILAVAGLAAGHRPVPRRPPRGSTAGRWRRPPAIAVADHGLLRLAVEPGRPRPRRRASRCAPAVAAYYRSQFLNTTLPGGVLGDVHRGVRHGRDAGDVGRGAAGGRLGAGRRPGRAARARRWSCCCCCRRRCASSMPRRRGRARGGRALGGVLLSRRWPPRGPSRWARAVRAAAADLRDGLLRAAGVAGHRARVRRGRGRPRWRRSWSPRGPPGSTASPAQLLPLALLVLLAMAVPTNVARLGSARGRGRVGVRRGRAGRGAGRRDGRGLRRAGARRQPARRGRAGRRLAPARPRATVGRRAAQPGRSAADAGGRAVADRPYTLLSCGMSIDGYLDSATEQRLLLSNDADLDRVDAVRAELRRDPGRRGDRPQRQPAAAGARPGAAGRAGRPRAARRRRSR